MTIGNLYRSFGKFISTINEILVKKTTSTEKALRIK